MVEQPNYTWDQLGAIQILLQERKMFLDNRIRQCRKENNQIAEKHRRKDLSVIKGALSITQTIMDDTDA